MMAGADVARAVEFQIEALLQESITSYPLNRTKNQICWDSCSLSQFAVASSALI